MTIYLLTEGSYSDYYVVGAFSTREKADAASDGDEDASIEEYELDGLAEHRYGNTWDASIEKESGEIRGGHSPYRSLRHPEAVTVFDNGGTFIAVTSPISAEHATKVAVEKRQEWLRTRDIGAVTGGS